MAKRTPKTIHGLADLTPHARNANLGTDGGRAMLAHSLEHYGAGRSILVDQSGHVIAGNKTLEEAQRLELPITVVRTRGDELVVVQREDLSLNDPKAQALAIADNRTGQADLRWNRGLLAEISAMVDLSPYWPEEQLEQMRGATDAETAAQLGAQEYRIVVECRDEAHQRELLEQFERDGLNVRALIS